MPINRPRRDSLPHPLWAPQFPRHCPPNWHHIPHFPQFCNIPCTANYLIPILQPMCMEWNGARMVHDFFGNAG